MLLKLRGVIEFDPVSVTKKHHKQGAWKCVAIIKTNCDMDKYYAWFIKKRFNLELNKNLRGSHVTFINDRMDKDIFNQAAKIFNGKEIDFYIEIEPRSNGKHWWFRAYSPDVENIREALGLSRDPYFGLHFTLGLVNDNNLSHSHYILRQSIRFNLCSNEIRKPIEEHQIIEFQI